MKSNEKTPAEQFEDLCKLAEGVEQNATKALTRIRAFQSTLGNGEIGASHLHLMLLAEEGKAILFWSEYIGTKLRVLFPAAQSEEDGQQDG